MKKLFTACATVALLAGCAQFDRSDRSDSGGMGSSSTTEIGGSEAPGYDTELDSQRGVFQPDQENRGPRDSIDDSNSTD